MSPDILRRDADFRRWLAARPGFWREVGVFDDAATVVLMMAERRVLGLPRLAILPTGRPCRVRRRAPRSGSHSHQAAEARA